MDAQIRDMEFVIEEMHDYPEVTIDRIALVGWNVAAVSQGSATNEEFVSAMKGHAD